MTVPKKTRKTKPVKQASRAGSFRLNRSLNAEIGDLPPIVNQSRRDSCRNDLALFLQTYTSEIFYRPICKDETDIIGDIQSAMKHGGRKAIALPRGFGKSSLAVGSMIWAGCYGHRRYMVVVGATDSAAGEILSDIKAHFESNPKLSEDFPEICFPISALDGRAQRCASQTYHGERTKIDWKTDRITLPSVGSQSDGVTIVSSGITGSIRGMHRTDAAGKWVRPDFVLLDDPQTRESASEETQTDKRERIILGDVMGLAGHGKAIAGIMAITVIAKNDLADRFLNRKRHPEWRGQKESLVKKWATNEKLWATYKEMRTVELLGEASSGSSSDFYKANRKEMDLGAEVLDPELYDHTDELSAIQHAYHLLADNGENAFLAEYQNSPVSLTPEAEYDLTAEIIRSRLNHRKQYQIPEGTVALTAGVDINRYAAAYCVTAYDNQMTGSVIDYGFWLPAGKKQLWSDNNGKEKGVYAAVLGVLNDLLKVKPYGKDIAATTVDAGFASQTVYDAILEARKIHKPAHIYASRGLPGDKYDLPRQAAAIYKRGYYADIRKAYPAGLILYFDSHYWHMQTQRGWLSEVGSPGGCSLWGTSAAKHAKFAEQVSADKLQKTGIINGKTFAVWYTNQQNEQGDCLAMCAAMATLEGVSPSGQGRLTKRQKAKAALAVPEAPKEDTEPSMDDQTEEQIEEKPAKINPIAARHTSLMHSRRAGGWASRW